MTVKLYANWPDYVFKPNYRLSDLATLKTYLNINHHLPDVPSAQDIEKNGVDLGKMNTLLLKKTEELTLYLIEKDKQLKEQQAQVATQQEEINLMKQQIDAIEKQLNKKKS
jgi:prolyl-tRNA editing enzyme YbaK/EbsC (Cys-tRNA(Pro) deacylase)